MSTYVLDAVKDISDGAGENSRDILISQHCKGFAGSGLTVKKNSPVVALKGSFGDGSSNEVVNLRSVGFRSKDMVILELLTLHCVLVPSSKFFLSD